MCYRDFFSFSFCFIYIMLWKKVTQLYILLLFPDTRHLAFNRGSDICLTCSNKTWNESLYVIWKIKLKSKICTIAFSINGEASKNNCSDGKSLRNTSTSQSYLHIPNFSANDVGDYMCEQAVRAGMETIRINVAFTGRTGFLFLLTGGCENNRSGQPLNCSPKSFKKEENS